MKTTDKRYIVGIDLGTTNCALSYVDLESGDEKPRIQTFGIPQVTAPGEVGKIPVLPSFLYLSGSYELPGEGVVLPWKSENQAVVGTFARDQGAKVPGRLVASAKSWLCHGKVDRTAGILPWNADKGVNKVSPVAATAAYLRHLRESWNQWVGRDEDLHLEYQAVTITVPASFDEVARDYTMEAARLAGLGEVTLLEEPLAAFYSWLVFHEHDWEKHVRPGELILACDVGGGTTDFTLITLREVDGHPRFERIAVGDHLILGGDNMDLALARNAESRMRKGSSQSLNANRWQALCYQCRQAKEAILSGSADAKTITLMGEGSKLIAQTLSASMDREAVEKIILDGFFPLVTAETRDPGTGKGGITEFGLPYEKDPAVTRHLCRFLLRHREDVKSYIGKEIPFPDLLLFNGGSLKPTVLQNRIREGIRHWFGADRMPGVLNNPDLDLAVARGAAYYGLVKAGQGVRVGSGSARGYYLGVGTGGGSDSSALCLVERGMEEGTKIGLSDREFEVMTNQPVSFQVYSSSFRSGDRAGDIVKTDDTLTRLPPIRTVIQFGKKGARATIPVALEAEYTELGALALWCRSVRTDHRWRLQFQLRDAEAPREVSNGEILEEAEVEAAQALLKNAFAPGGPDPEALMGTLAGAVSRPREKWPLSLIRRVADDLLKLENGRRLSPVHEARWLNLLGFALRPGFGDALDPHRMKKLWGLYKKGPVHDKNPQVRLEWWVLWRRAAGGLSPGQQRQILQDLMPVIRPKKGAPSKASPQEALEIQMLLANLERLQVKDKVDLGDRLLKGLNPKKAKNQHWWSLGRLGARELLYGPLDRVISPEDAARWTRKILETPWKNPRPAGQALSQLARKTGDRKRDVEEAVAREILDWLALHEWGAGPSRQVREVVAVTRVDEAARFGESLPEGLVMKTEASFPEDA